MAAAGTPGHAAADFRTRFTPTVCLPVVCSIWRTAPCRPTRNTRGWRVAAARAAFPAPAAARRGRAARAMPTAAGRARPLRSRCGWVGGGYWAGRFGVAPVQLPVWLGMRAAGCSVRHSICRCRLPCTAAGRVTAPRAATCVPCLCVPTGVGVQPAAGGVWQRQDLPQRQLLALWCARLGCSTSQQHMPARRVSLLRLQARYKARRPVPTRTAASRLTYPCLPSWEERLRCAAMPCGRFVELTTLHV